MNTQLKWYSFRWKTGLVLVLMCVMLWYYMQGRFIHPVGSGPAGPSVSKTPFSHTWSTGRIVFLGLGDSITSGYGASTGHSYFDLLVKNDDAKYPEMRGIDLSHVYPNLQPSNEAQPYTTSEEHLNDQIQYMTKYPSDTKGIVVITTGGNDLIHDYGRSAPTDGAMYGCTYQQAQEWKENYRGRLKKIVEGISKQFPGGCEIFLGNVYDPTDGVGDIQNAHLLLPKWKDAEGSLKLMNQAIAETAEQYPNVHLVDIRSTFLGHGIHCRSRHNPNYRRDDPYYWYFSNLEDPNDRGYDALRRIFLLEMAKVLGPDS